MSREVLRPRSQEGPNLPPEREHSPEYRPMNHDVINPFNAVRMLAEYLADELEFLKEDLAEMADLPTYQEYVESLDHPGHDADQVIRETNPEDIGVYNGLVTEFNQNRASYLEKDPEQIKEALSDLYKRAEQLIRPDKA